jgi:hypothetical protein
MSLSGLEPVEKQIFTPAVEVATGQATVEQVHRVYKGMELICPHCQQEWKAQLGNDAIAEMLTNRSERSLLRMGYTKEMMEEIKREGLDNSGLLDAVQAGVRVLPDKLRVRFRSGCLDKANSISRWMHWAHVAHRGIQEKKPPCYEPGNINHDVALSAIKYTLEEQFKTTPHICVSREKEIIIIPGEPPLKRRPDLAVRGANGRVIMVVEVQRTPLPKDDFIERTQHLMLSCRDVRWIFFKSAYSQMGPQRQWLRDMGLPFYYLHFKDFRVVIEDGKPPTPREKMTGSKPTKSDCHFHDDPSESSGRPHKPESFLPFGVVGAAILPTGFSQPPPEPEFKVGDEVEAWVEGKWLEAIVSGRDLKGNLSVRLKRAINGKCYFSAFLIRWPQRSQHTFQAASKSLPQESSTEQLDLFQSR